jgi:hypothetical protein
VLRWRPRADRGERPRIRAGLERLKARPSHALALKKAAMTAAKAGRSAAPRNVNPRDAVADFARPAVP